MSEARTDRRVVVGVTLVILVVMVAIRAFAADSDDLVRLAEFERRAGVDVGPDTAWLATGIGGDADLFVIIAVDPLGSDTGRLIYAPSFRYARAGYSWLGAAVTLGRDDLALLGLSLVGLASVAITIMTALRLADRLGNRVLFILLNPALFIGFLRDTAEPLAIALLVLAMSGSAAGVVGLSLVRPSYLAGLVPLGRRFVAGLAVAAAFRVYWVLNFGDSITGGAWNFGLPLAGVLAAPSLAGYAVAAAGLYTLVVGVLRRDLGWMLAGLMVVLMSEVVYDNPVNAVRAAGLLPVLWAFGPGYLGEVRKRVGAVGVTAPT